MRLADALRIRSGMVIAFVGAGGKSSAMRRIVQEISAEIPLIVTTTTKLGFEQSNLAASHMVAAKTGDLNALGARLREWRSVLVTGPLGTGEPKWLGLDQVQLEIVHKANADAGAVMLIEADGARRRALKAPAQHEPVIPPFADLVVPIAGIDALGAPLSEDVVHRPELVAQCLGLEIGIELTTQHIADLMTSPDGGLKSVPDTAEVRLLINKIESRELHKAGQSIAERALQREAVRAVVLGAVGGKVPVLEVRGRVGGVVLAAGGSTRLNHPKQLVLWKGKPLVWHAVRAARAGGLSPVVVVLGSGGNEVKAALREEEVIFVDNPHWQDGQSASLRAGLAAVADQVEGAVFLLSDMPLVGGALIEALVERHQSTLAPIVVPKIGDRRANPVLFDRNTFTELMDLQGDVGGRALFDRFSSETIDWHEDVFLDVDTDEDLRRLEAME
jgi:molybdenum cofactor cytidylyltransferase